MQILAHVMYEPIREIGIGQGLNSKVYLVNDPQLGGQVAVKEIPTAPLGKSGVDNIFNEAQVMFAAQHSENVVPINFAGRLPNKEAICLVMPYYRKGSLQDRIIERPISLQEVVRVGLGILTGLESIHGHERRFVHFDVKPSNVLFSNRDAPMVADFGQSRTALNAGKVAMPPLYRGGIPPEFFGSGVGGVETDIYQVGLTLYRAVNGDAFFQSQRPQTEDELREKTLAGTFPNRGKFLAHVPRPLARVIRKALRVNHLERYRTASDMSNALAKCTFDNDWATICRNDGGYDWSCSRDGQPGLEVELIKNGNRWNVNTFTVGDKRRRRNNLCLANARRAESQRHLRDVFAQLG